MDAGGGNEGAQMTGGKAQPLAVVGLYTDVAGFPLIVGCDFTWGEVQTKTVTVDLSLHFLRVMKGIVGMIYKVVETSEVTDEKLEALLNQWTLQGWRFDSLQFAMREGNRRPGMAFIFFTREDAVPNEESSCS